MHRAIPWILAGVPAFVFLQSLPFKFTGHPHTEHIFGTIGQWFADIGLGLIAGPFASWGGIGVGVVELVASVLLLWPAQRPRGALLGVLVLSGAIFFHLVTPLGIAIDVPGEAGPNPTLFFMAVVSWLCMAALLVLEHDGLRRSSVPA